MSEQTNARTNRGFFEPAVVMSILTIVVSGATTYGGLMARMTALEQQHRDLKDVPVQLARIDARLSRMEEERHDD